MIDAERRELEEKAQRWEGNSKSRKLNGAARVAFELCANELNAWLASQPTESEKACKACGEPCAECGPIERGAGL